VALNKEKTILGDVVFEGIFKNKKHKKIGAILANSAITALSAELAGRINLGEGLLTTYGPEINEFLLPNPDIIDSEFIESIEKAFTKLSQRPVKPIFEEVKMKDRQKLDSLVLEAMGLDPEKYLQPIYDGLTELVRERIELAAMRKQKSKSKVIKDITKLTEQVRDELVNSGIKKFPDAFLSTKLKPQDCTNVSVPDVPLRLGHYFMGQQDVTGEGFNYTARSLEAAKYIIYAHKPGEYIVCLPNDDIIVTKAVVEYEHYLKELFKKLNAEILNRTFDHKQAESISKRIFEELGLPLVGG